MFKWLLILSVTLSITTLRAETKMLAFSGSTRNDSFNKKLINEAVHLARQLGAKVTLVDLKDYPLPFYEGDLEAKEGMPAKARQLRQLMIQSNVILIASPEYNSSIPAVVKNVIDWASRKEEGGSSREAFKGKTFLIMSAAPGKGGGAKGLSHLRTIIQGIGGIVLQQQLVVPDAYNAFDEQGHLKNPQLRLELQQMIQAGMLSSEAKTPL